MGPHGRHIVGTRERRSAAQHLERGARQRVLVAWPAHRVTLNLFRRHVRRGTEKPAGGGYPGYRQRSLTEPEISQVDVHMVTTA
jgi:hypothetical protein